MLPLIAMVTDRARVDADPARQADLLVRAAAVAADAGIDLIQVRERGLADRSLRELVARIVESTSATDARVLVNERTDVAIAAGAAGVHLPAAAVDSRRVRDIAPPGFLIGRSVHSEAEVAAEEAAQACDYLLFGTVFPTPGKGAGAPIAGVDALASVCRGVRLPVLAIGGMTPERFPAIAAAGAAGVAAIGLFHGPPVPAAGDVRQIVARLRAAYAVPSPGDP